MYTGGMGATPQQDVADYGRFVVSNMAVALARGYHHTVRPSKAA